MFGSSAVSLMLMILLCFMGMLIMFLFVLRALADHKIILENKCNQMQTTLAEIEQQLLDLDFLVRQTHENHQEKPNTTSNLHKLPQNISELFPPSGYAKNRTLPPLRGHEQENTELHNQEPVSPRDHVASHHPVEGQAPRNTIQEQNPTYPDLHLEAGKPFPSKSILELK